MLVEDNPEYRNVVGVAMKRDPSMELIDMVGTAERALSILQDRPEDERPDIILLDLALPGVSGLEAISALREGAPDSRIIILTQSDKKADVLSAISQGAAGYLLKSSTVKEIKEGIRTVMDGGASLDSGMARYVLNTLQTKLSKTDPSDTLSEREMEVLTLLADGLVKKEIAAKLNISFFTVATHIRHIYDKLNVVNAPAAVSKAYRMGIFPREGGE